MPDLEKLSQQHVPNNNDKNASVDGNEPENNVEQDNEMTNTQEIVKQEESCLVEFETQEFPIEPDSTQSSLLLDDVSNSSAQEINHVTLPSPPPPPLIHIENVDELHESEVHEIEKTAPVLSSSKLANLYMNPVFLLVLIAIAMIPVSVIVQMKFS